MSTNAPQFCTEGLEPFPALDQASPDGLLAVGGDLSPDRLRCAYSSGIFPWFEEGQPILWWSPDPRCVLYPDQFRTSRSLRKSIRRSGFRVRFDQNFSAVVKACAADRTGQRGTWITPQMHDAYCALYDLNCAHSVEVYQKGKLVGGLYGVALGKVFYGESMFSHVNDASKFALKYLTQVLQEHDYQLIDCQIESPHLLSLGAQSIPRTEFIERMNRALKIEDKHQSWSALEYKAA